MLVLLAATAAVLLAGASSPRPAAEPDGVIFFTGNVLGYLEECGCPKLPLGGLDRRAAEITGTMRRWTGAWKLAFDVGNFSETPGPSGDVKTRGLVEAMNKLGYGAAGIGEQDLLGGPGQIDALREIARFPFLSATLERRSAKEWLPPYALFNEEGARVAVIGATRFNPMLRHRFENGDQLVSTDPFKKIGPLVRTLREQADLIILLALLPIDDARRLVREVPDIDLVLGAHGSYVTRNPVVEGSTMLLYVGDQGKFLGRVAVYAAADGPSLEGEVVPLQRGLPGDPAMEIHVVSVLAEAQEAEQLRQATVDPAGGERGTPRFLGSGACTACHPSIVAEWATTRHARAFQSLSETLGGPREVCVSCHTTGSGLAGGFTSRDRTPHLASVGCESCHGAAGSHVAQPERPYGRVSMATCTACHTAEQDADFSYYESLSRVNHGASLTR